LKKIIKKIFKKIINKILLNGFEARSLDFEDKTDLFHFTNDYRRHVQQLIKENDIDTAMSLAVGGQWEEIGIKLSKLVQSQGVSSGMDVLDFGCGSGRLAYALAQDVDLKSYVGLDVVQELLTYAEQKCPKHYKFILNNSLSIPFKDSQFDFALGFSIFTHLLQTEIMLYSKEIFDLLKPGGIFIYSFLEFEYHWDIFERDYITHKKYSRPYPVLNMFLNRNQIEIMASKCGFVVEKFIEPQKLGQSVVILKKPN
tara:strand:+ start:203 stop:967 length:765 start_codon:yes stop_codon:yes gene_type:complete